MKSIPRFIVFCMFLAAFVPFLAAQSGGPQKPMQRLAFKNIEMGIDAMTVLKNYKPKNGWGQDTPIGSGPYCWVRIPTRTLNIEPKQQDSDTVGSAAATVSFSFRIENDSDFDSLKNGMRPQLSETTTEVRAAMGRTRLFKIQCSFKRISYPVIKDALISKFGQAVLTDTIDVKNKMGASFTVERITWRSSGGIVMLQEAGETLDRSVLIYTDPDFSPDVAERNAKDL